MNVRKLLIVLVALTMAAPVLADPLPSWHDRAAKAAIVSFVAAVTDASHADFVPQADRIAVFDNDGTLWAENPIYLQVYYALDTFAQRAASDPALVTGPYLEAAAKGDLAGVLAGGEAALLALVDASHAGQSVAEFQQDVRDWLWSTRHPVHKDRLMVEMVYEPMLELLSYLRENGFRTYIVSGGGVDFIRAFAAEVYGIPPHQVVGSVGNHSYQVIDGTPYVRKEAGISFIDDKAGKPVAIVRHIGARPVFAAGNSDGDFQMLEWTTAGDGARFALLVHHTDAEREWAYDRDGHVGKLVRGLDEGPQRGWTIVDMKSDWQRVFP